MLFGRPLYDAAFSPLSGPVASCPLLFACLISLSFSLSLLSTCVKWFLFVLLIKFSSSASHSHFTALYCAVVFLPFLFLCFVCLVVFGFNLSILCFVCKWIKAILLWFVRFICCWRFCVFPFHFILPIFSLRLNAPTLSVTITMISMPDILRY